MADGTHKPIEQVKTGDKVTATDPDTGRTEAKPVVDLITSEGVKNLVQITVDTDGTKGAKTGVVISTDTHPFWVTNLRTWVPATRLTPGAWLRTAAGTHAQITAIAKWTTAHQHAHNLTVADTNTYYVMADDQAILVHNQNRRPPKLEFPEWNAGDGANDDGNRTPRNNQAQNKSFDGAIKVAEHKIG